MNDRKQHVIQKAHQLFIENGFQATSIQDILDFSKISKGTFYNYFSSKNELLIELFTTIHQKMDKERNELLIGQDPSDISIFIKQVELQLKTNRANRLLSLFEEVIVSNDADLKHFIREGQLKMIQWLYTRFIDLFGENKKAYLLDCAIMFMGILHQNLKYSAKNANSNVNLYQVVQYSVNLIVTIVNEVSKTGAQLFSPELLDHWFEPFQKKDNTLQKELTHYISTLKKSITNQTNKLKLVQLLDFIQEELVNNREPRKFLIESALSSLRQDKALESNDSFKSFEQIVHAYLQI